MMGAPPVEGVVTSLRAHNELVLWTDRDGFYALFSRMIPRPVHSPQICLTTTQYVYACPKDVTCTRGLHFLGGIPLRLQFVMASKRSAKRRRRADSPEEEHGNHPIRSQPWFEDGNVILEAEATQFRVYRGILAANSTVFKDMFEFAQPEVDGSVGGCPVVQLSDSVEDLQHVLEVLHDAQSRCVYFIIIRSSDSYSSLAPALP
jgi:hypothetical protein